MGFEYNIVTKLNEGQKQDIQRLLEKHGFRSENRKDDGGFSYELQNSEQADRMPESIISIDDLGLYICQNLKNDPWVNLADLKKYLDSKQIIYRTEEL